MPRHRFLPGFLAGLLLLPAAPAAAQSDYAVKAAYLTKFVPFLQWPDTAFAGAASPVVICVLGDDPFGGKLEQAAQGLKSGDHAVTVRHLAAPDTGCQMLFLHLGDPVAAQEALDALKGQPVVTVTDSDNPVHGMISFVTADNHVRFDIDDAAAAQAGIGISSKLLGLAHIVRQRGAP